AHPCWVSCSSAPWSGPGLADRRGSTTRSHDHGGVAAHRDGRPGVRVDRM
ncbi:MAG: hypothetical protein AVDCRST_MAG66-4792, partial [uncultured Pseudonocardia sp.]